MYRFAQRRMAIVAAVAVVVLAVVIFMVFPGVYADPKAGPLCALLLVMALTIFAYLLLRFASVRVEAVLVALRVRKGKIALARIDAVEALGEARDICMIPHRLCALKAEVHTADGASFACRIVEDIEKTPEIPLPSWVFVTCDGEFGEGRDERVGVVPTPVVFATPSLEPIVRGLESACHPSYVEVSRGVHGLRLVPFSRKKK